MLDSRPAYYRRGTIRVHALQTATFSSRVSPTQHGAFLASNAACTAQCASPALHDSRSSASVMRSVDTVPMPHAPPQVVNISLNNILNTCPCRATTRVIVAPSLSRGRRWGNRFNWSREVPYQQFNDVEREGA